MRRVPIAVSIATFVTLFSFAAGIARAQSPSPTPSPSGSSTSASPSPSASPSSTESSPSPTPSSASPTPTPSPTDDSGNENSDQAATVEIRVTPAGGVAEAGDLLTYSLVVANPGGTSIDGLTVTDIVPDELDVTGVPIVDAASAINLISIGSDEQIVWTIDELHPGAQVTLPWNASVSTTGDLVAMNEATATTEDSTARAAQNVYLARSSAPEVHGSTTAAAPATQTKKVIRYEQRRIPAGSAPAVIPFTGAPVWGWMVLALALIVVGAAFTRVRRSPLILCGLLALVLMAACTNAGQDPSAGAPTRSARPSPEGSSTEDEVLGTRIHRNSNGSPADGSATDGSSTDAAADTTAANTTAPQIPEPQEDLVQVVSVPVVVEVESQPASEVLTSIEGDNFVTFSWDEMDRQVTDAASSRTLSRAASATLLSELSTASPSIAPSVELVNLSSTTLVVRGDLGIRTLDASGADAATTSEFVDVVLAPGGSVSLDFEYVLPSGDYSSVPFFAAG